MSKAEDKTQTNAKVEPRELSFQEQLAAMEQVEILIPLPDGVEPDSKEALKLFVPLQINGHIWQINRGRKVRVPVLVRDVLRQSGISAY